MVSLGVIFKFFLGIPFDSFHAFSSFLSLKRKVYGCFLEIGKLDGGVIDMAQ